MKDIKAIEAELPHLIEHVPAVVFRLSRDGDEWRTWYVTRNVSMYGYTAEDFLSGSVHWLDLVHPDDRVMLNKTIRDYEAQNINQFRLYYRLITKNGDSVPVTEYNTVNRDADGSIICYDTIIVSNSQDEAGRQLIDDHYRQQVVLNDILMSLHDSDLDHALQIILDRTGQYLDTSRALLFKDNPDHTTCKILYEWCNRDIPSVMVLDYSITYETGMPEIYRALQSVGNLLIHFGEIPENCKEEFEAEGLIASAIFAVYLNGEHYGFVCFDDCVIERRWDEETVRFLKNIANIISTVLARQDAAKRLGQNQKTYEAVLNNIDSYIFVVDPATRNILFANKAFRDAFSEEARDKVDACIALVERNGATEGPFPELYCERTDEWIAVSDEAVTWIDGSTARLFTCYDITAKKRFADTLEEKIQERTHELRLMTREAESAKERAEDASLAKSQFLANMSHEIRTPMNAILGLAEVLSESTLNDSQREHLRNIRRSSEILLNLINDILDLSKMEAGRLSLVPVHYNLRQAVDHVASLFRGMAESKGVEFRFVSSGALSMSLYGDDIRLRQILINILGNAVKYTSKGHVEFGVDVGEATLTFRVTDTGVGIRPEEVGSIFEHFSQADIHKNRKIQGAGLGLAICKSLVELMGGTLQVASVYGEGSTFTLTIPLVPGDETMLERETPGPRNLSAPEARILVVDDVDINLYVAEALLEEYGIRATLAASGEEAVALAKETAFDLIFMDHMMPGMNGIDTALALRALGGANETVPVIMLTANVVAEAQSMYALAGMNDFLAKPIEPAKLTTILHKWLPKEKILGE